ncbi:MAG: hypothetical protein NTX25_08565 [Proteobacteria bacterium]|nr:hypothetical protein [Pseudomonadota bacterium]
MKMNYPSCLMVLVFWLSLSACSHVLMNSPLVSMTKRTPPGNAKIKEIGPVKADFCQNHTPVSGHSPARGLMDEVILKAQKSEKIDYIRNAQFTVHGFWVKCMMVEGEGLALVK